MTDVAPRLFRARVASWLVGVMLVVSCADDKPRPHVFDKPPTATCGVPIGTDQSFRIPVDRTARSCVVHFAHPWEKPPGCQIVFADSPTAEAAWSTSITALTFTFGATPTMVLAYCEPAKAS